ncbi:HutD family protein [Streptococcus ictaluri]|uniref:HutD n=1 Tax=Streptococcus ictaluri 707-05 TaxID=764299 RepID=G5K5G7_9STRE|nr:HutD family protein [Streptococcus ictaluri]EHI68982.1 hypothetical protein STRIC_2082 [Streptococcus ictaluri 707-05]
MIDISLIRPSDYVQSDWSGGKTTQLYLYPEKGHYKPGHFAYRLSTATVALRQTTFTLLEDYHRLLMPLDKTIILSDLSHSKEISLAPFESYAFEGSSRMVSRGTCQDVNLIYDDHYKGQLKAIWQADDIEESSAHIHLIYALEDIEIKLENQQQITLPHKHLLVLKDNQQKTNWHMSQKGKTYQKPLAIWTELWETL